MELSHPVRCDVLLTQKRLSLGRAPQRLSTLFERLLALQWRALGIIDKLMSRLHESLREQKR
jgi:uncharacterized protein with von Willebrand factor type A (vWA) domain